MSDSLVLTVERLINAPVIQVFQAFEQREFIAQWFKPSADVVIEVLGFDFYEGGRYRLRYLMPDTTEPILHGEYLKISKPHEVVFSWGWEAPHPYADTPSLVSVTFIDKGAKTLLKVRHEKIPTQSIAGGHAIGWHGALDCLEQILASTSVLNVSSSNDQSFLRE